MGFLETLFGKFNDDVEVFFPGGKKLNTRIEVNRLTHKVSYTGAYGSKATFNLNDVTSIEIKVINEYQSIILIHGNNSILGTFDIMKTSLAEEIKTWFDHTIDTLIGKIGDITNTSECEGNISSSQNEEMNIVQRLEHLKELLKKGLISEEEFKVKKEEILKRL